MLFTDAQSLSSHLSLSSELLLSSLKHWPELDGLANVDMKGPRDWKAAWRTYREQKDSTRHKHKEAHILMHTYLLCIYKSQSMFGITGKETWLLYLTRLFRHKSGVACTSQHKDGDCNNENRLCRPSWPPTTPSTHPQYLVKYILKNKNEKQKKGSISQRPRNGKPR